MKISNKKLNCLLEKSVWSYFLLKQIFVQLKFVRDYIVFIVFKYFKMYKKSKLCSELFFDCNILNTFLSNYR